MLSATRPRSWLPPAISSTSPRTGAVGCFAAAQTSEFTLRPHRFELSGTTAIDQEMVEVVAVDCDVVLAQAATVIRIPGLGVWRGPFGTP